MYGYNRKTYKDTGYYLQELFGLPKESFYPEDPPIPSEIANDDEGTIISLDVPGVKKEDITIDLSDNKINVTSTRANVTRYWKRDLTDSADQDKVMAHLENGVLEVTIPRKEKKISKTIKIT